MSITRALVIAMLVGPACMVDTGFDLAPVEADAAVADAFEPAWGRGTHDEQPDASRTGPPDATLTEGGIPDLDPDPDIGAALPDAGPIPVLDAALPSEPDAAPPEPDSAPDQGPARPLVFVLVEESASWHEAEADCVARGGHLASIRNQVEMDQVKRLFPVLPYDRFAAWIGLQTPPERWSDGTPVEWTFWGEPPGGPGLCVRMLPGIHGQWHAWDCAEQPTGSRYWTGSYVCEVPDA